MNIPYFYAIQETLGISLLLVMRDAAAGKLAGLKKSFNIQKSRKRFAYQGTVIKDLEPLLQYLHVPLLQEPLLRNETN